MTALSPAEIETSAQLAAALKQLCGTRSLRAIEKTAKELRARGGRMSALPTSTVGGVLTGKSVPSVDTLVALLRVCQVSGPAQQEWLEARDRVEHRHHHRPSGAVRVRDARPRRLGVHAAIQTHIAQQHGRDGLPPYVPRDLDADLRTQLTAAEQEGGFVVLVGGSSVGKTRALFEAIRTVLPNWWLLHPADTDLLRQAAAAPTDRTVVWLDELQNYLNHPSGLPTSVIRDLINAGIVVVATVWPGEYSKRVTRPIDGQPDPYAEDRQLLNLAEVVTVPGTFSPTERRRAEDLAHTDPRIRVALDTPDAGFTQVMAAGPALIRHWEQAPADQCYGQAVITAALDARRVGARAPATRAYLEAAAPGYLTDRQQASAPTDWLNHALAYATTHLHGATATLCPVASRMGHTAGYQVADYVHQHALRVRRTEHLPDTAWHALVQHHHPDDTRRLADSARRRGRDHETETLKRQLVDAGDSDAVRELAVRLAKKGRVNEALTRLRPLADNGDASAAQQLADLLAEHGRIEELTHRADNDDPNAAHRVANLLVEQGRIDEALTCLRSLADNGDDYSARHLVNLLVEHGRIEELTHRADNGHLYAANRLCDLLIKRGRVDEALTRLRPLADNGDPRAAHRLASVLAKRGQVDEALTRLRNLIDNGYTFAARGLCNLLVEHGRIEELTHRADNGLPGAANRLCNLLVEHGRIEKLTHRADNGDRRAAYLLAELLAEQSQVDELTRRADDGDLNAVHRLAKLRVEQGRVDEALTRLRSLADNGDDSAAHELVNLLAEHGRADELNREVAAGTTGAWALRALDQRQWTDRQTRMQTLLGSVNQAALAPSRW